MKGIKSLVDEAIRARQQGNSTYDNNTLLHLLIAIRESNNVNMIIHDKAVLWIDELEKRRKR